MFHMCMEGDKNMSVMKRKIKDMKKTTSKDEKEKLNGK